MVRRTRVAAVLTLAMINVCTLAAGIAVARMLPARLAALRVPSVAAGPALAGGAVLSAGTQAGSLPTSSGLRSALAGPLSAPALGPQVSVLVADSATGRVLLSENGAQLATPASTAKLATALAALEVLGGGARFTTRVVSGAGPGSIILVGGGDPTLAVNQFPAQDYPGPATLASLAASTARVLKSAARTTVSLGYDASLYTGPGLAPGWPGDYVSAGDVTPIVSLEVDQGRLTPAGVPEDSDDPYNLRARASDPAPSSVANEASAMAAGTDARARRVYVSSESTGSPAGVSRP
jgi:serine-type D-Ala-D-Ala carboxypeptidase/endopeptidase (penicillin-binding protein 4)